MIRPLKSTCRCAHKKSIEGFTHTYIVTPASYQEGWLAYPAPMAIAATDTGCNTKPEYLAHCRDTTRAFEVALHVPVAVHASARGSCWHAFLLQPPGALAPFKLQNYNISVVKFWQLQFGPKNLRHSAQALRPSRPDGTQRKLIHLNFEGRTAAVEKKLFG